MDYQKTLNLPKTDFSMRAGLSKKEPQYLAQWKKLDLYEKIKKQSAGQKPFILHDGPPYANGNIHIGHALNKILKDFIVKYKAMCGFDSQYVPGWDCHGLPIEHQLLKELKKKKGDVDCVEFRRDAHDYALKYVGIQKEQFKRLGILGDWEAPYLTLNKDYEYWILKSLERLTVDGYVNRGLKPVNWCYQCETALAEAEVEYEDHKSTTVYVKFEVTNADALWKTDKKVSLLIWTTTPWTLAANVAVSVNAQYTYVFVDLGDDIIILEKTLAPQILEAVEQSDAPIVHEVTGEELTQLIYKQPFDMLDECKVVAADYVTKEDGTGLVHTAPGHGADDFLTGKKYDLPTLMPVGDNGVYTEGPFEGMHVSKALGPIMTKLHQKSALFHKGKLVHSYPHCWRCKTPIIFRATHQWFLKVDHKDLRARVADIIKKEVKFVPETGQERILGMVAGRPDWCLSRQRYWGVPIPALKSEKDGLSRLYPEVIARFAEIVKTEGTDAWFKRDVNDFLPEGFVCPETGATEFTKTFDILDVWFDSGVSHQAVVKSQMGRKLPAQLYLEGSDQHRGWFQSSLIPAVAMEGHAPFEEVLTHGFVVDGQGRKMSKSLGNVISPLDIIKNSGADILRLWVASSSYNEDIRISKEVLDRSVDGYRKIRNTFRYILGNVFDFDPNTEILAYDDLEELDQWALARLAVVVQEAHEHFENYAFAKVYKLLYTFCNEDLSNNYLDILKDRLYIPASFSKERKSAQTVLYHMLSHLVRLLAPFLVFTTEEVFDMMPKTDNMKKVDSVHLLGMLEVPQEWVNQAILDEFELLFRIRPYVLKALEDQRGEGLIGSSLDAKIVFETSSDKMKAYLDRFGKDLADMFIVSQSDVVQTEEFNDGLSDEFKHTRVKVLKADGQKCARSWKYTTDIGQDPDYPDLSLRCAKIVKELLNASEEKI